MIPLRWTEQAADDLAAIRDFIARDSAAYAHVVAERLYLSVGYLREFPDLGRVVPERGQPELRELIRSRYRIVYRHFADGVTCAAILLVMIVVALSASLVPALRATRIDPIKVLKQE